MPIRRGRDSIDQGSSANLWLSRSKVHDQPRDQLRLVGVREGRPGRAGISAVDCDLGQALGRRDAGGELAGKVEEECLGAAVLMGLLHAVLVVAEALEVGAGLGDGHGEGGRVDAEGGDEGEDGRV